MSCPSFHSQQCESRRSSDGFISCQPGNDVFVNFSALQSNGLRSLQEGGAVEVRSNQGTEGLPSREWPVSLIEKAKLQRGTRSEIRCRAGLDVLASCWRSRIGTLQFRFLLASWICGIRMSRT
jgi:cold shock CspA family protein